MIRRKGKHMPDTTVKKIKRSEFAAFLNIAPSSTASYARMGKGITGQTVAYNPTVNTEQYINEDSATNSVDAYAPSINTPQTCYAGEPVFEFVDGLRRKRAVGADAETDIVLVYIYSKSGDSGTAYNAEKCKCVISVEEFGGDAGNPVSITYTVSLNGDPILGTATVANGAMTFTEASA